MHIFAILGEPKRQPERPQEAERAPKATPGQPKGRQSDSDFNFFNNFGAENLQKTEIGANLVRQSDFAKIAVLPR